MQSFVWRIQELDMVQNVPGGEPLILFSLYKNLQLVGEPLTSEGISDYLFGNANHDIDIVEYVRINGDKEKWLSVAEYLKEDVNAEAYGYKEMTEGQRVRGEWR